MEVNDAGISAEKVTILDNKAFDGREMQTLD